MHKNLPPHVRNDITLPTPACELILPRRFKLHPPTRPCIAHLLPSLLSHTSSCVLLKAADRSPFLDTSMHQPQAGRMQHAVKLPLLHLDSPDQSLPMLHQSFLHPQRFLAEHNVLIPCQVSLSLRSVNMVAQCFECDQGLSSNPAIADGCLPFFEELVCLGNEVPHKHDRMQELST